MVLSNHSASVGRYHRCLALSAVLEKKVSCWCVGCLTFPQQLHTVSMYGYTIIFFLRPNGMPHGLLVNFAITNNAAIIILILKSSCRDTNTFIEENPRSGSFFIQVLQNLVNFAAWIFHAGYYTYKYFPPYV